MLIFDLLSVDLMVTHLFCLYFVVYVINCIAISVRLQQSGDVEYIKTDYGKNASTISKKIKVAGKLIK